MYDGHHGETGIAQSNIVTRG